MSILLRSLVLFMLAFIFHKAVADNLIKIDETKNVLYMKQDEPGNKVSSILNLKNIICPDKRSYCPNNTTCCYTGAGYGCCLTKNAVCCPDKEHCCAQGYKCGKNRCYRETDSVELPISTKMSTLEITREVNNVICPDRRSQCPSGTTCCRMASGQFGCCPLPQAVCCSDRLHCCPNSYTCGSGRCFRGQQSVPFVKKIPSTKIQEIETREVNNVICPDRRSQCPSGTTCCRMASGQFGCCPLPQAVCCSDRLHCCPNGYTCGSGRCFRGQESVPFVKKIPSTKVQEIETREVNNVICPDRRSQCPSGTTCCRLASGQFGCCPLSQAVCCSDRLHCCPNSYTCGSGKCFRGQESVPFVKKIPSTRIQEIERPPVNEIKASTGFNLGNIICPDKRSQCPDNSTCCYIGTAHVKWGCCLMPKAVCCSDRLHCCPNGFTCRAGKCFRGQESVPFVKKIPSTKVQGIETREVNNVICPDRRSQCPPRTTCCRMAFGKFGCCPFPRAVCCSDRRHCCMNGFKCGSGKCILGQISLPFVRKIPSKKFIDSERSVICPDRKSVCPSSQTCCRLSNSSYGCCPFYRAVCCANGVSCCPYGTVCDLSTRTCLGKSATFVGLMGTKTAAFKMSKII